MTSRDLVKATLEFSNTNKIPRDIWTLPWAKYTYPDEFNKLFKDYPPDILTAPANFKQKSKVSTGDMYEIGEYTDWWGCKIINKQRGIVGEVKEPIVKDDDWDDWDNVHIPEEWLSFDIEEVNSFCDNTDKYVLCGCYPRPFEQLQFIRGTENLFMDLVYPCDNLLKFIEKMHDFYCRQLEKWAQTKVDALMIMDDWGSQNSLLINPKTWVEIFKPLYKDYINIAKKHNKKMFMHSDGNITQILPHLVELGLDAINSQIFCMDMNNLKQYAGKITFWGEIDRQYILPYGTKQDVRDAVKKIMDNLYKNGGVIAQCEFSIGAKPENVLEVYEEWNKY